MRLLSLLIVFSVSPAFAGEERFLRGDLDADHALDLTDAVGILSHLFLLDPATLDCEDAADLNDDGGVNIADPLVPMPLSKRDPPVLTKRDPPGRAILPRADRVAFLSKEPAGFAGGC